MHTQYDLDIFWGLLFTAVKLPLQQGYVKIVPHVSWKKDNREFMGLPHVFVSNYNEHKATTEPPTHLGG